MACHCADGWICKVHPDEPWPHQDCLGPGEPCPACNTSDPPHLPANWVSLLAADDDEIAERLKRETRARLKESRQLLDAAKQTPRNTREGR
jgi:hypothetical protein